MDRFAIRLTLIAVLALSHLFAPDAHAANPPTQTQIQKAIQRGQAFLKSRQKDDGSVRQDPGATHRTGLNALYLLALMESGLTSDDRSVKKGLKIIRSAKQPEMTYYASLQLILLAAVGDKTDRPLMKKLVKAIEEGQMMGKFKGGWGYRVGKPDDRIPVADRCNTRFAVLGLHAASCAGIPVKSSTWKALKSYLQAGQGRDGGWGYVTSRHLSTGSMTSASLTSLMIASHWLRLADPRDNSTRRGFDWLSKNLRTIYHNPGSRSNNFFFLHCLKQAARVDGRRRVGKHDWYAEGAAFLLRNQRDDGSWIGYGLGENDRIVATCFAIFFLSQNDVFQLRRLSVAARRPASSAKRERKE